MSELHHLAASVTATSFRRAITGLVIALLLLLSPRAWRVGRLAITAVHESGHAVMVLATGGQVGAVHLRPDSSGVTWHRGVQGRWRRALTSAAGYPAPPLVGLAGAGLVAAGHTRAWLAALAALAALLALAWVRNAFGWLLTVAAGAGLVWLLAAGPDRGVALAGAACAWYLGLGGLRAALEACGEDARRARHPGRSDSAELGRLAVLPAGMWRGLFVLTAAGSVAASAALLV